MSSTLPETATCADETTSLHDASGEFARCDESESPAPQGEYPTGQSQASQYQSNCPQRLADENLGPAKRDQFFQRKYRVDRLVGSGLLVATSPVTLSLYVLVRLTSRGPGFYRQERVGLNGETFQIVKLRSMTKNAEKPGKPVWCVKNDSRITWLGHVLRKLHLDELPQLWNVARGEMSLVGPRPERPEICETLAEEIEDYYARVTVAPGVTGLSQINLPPDLTVDDVRRKQVLDLHYIEEANAWLEARILMATAMRMVGIKGEIVMKSMRLSRRELLQEIPVNSEDQAATRTNRQPR